jgi:Metal-dependent proteases with possible chaperone activity
LLPIYVHKKSYRYHIIPCVFFSHGGIIPPIARNLHQQHIEHVVKDALRLAGIQLSDVDAIAATVKPGMDIFRIYFLSHESNESLY